MADTSIHDSSFEPSEWSRPASSVVTREPVTFPFWQLLVLGVVSVLLGIAVLAWPDATARVLAVLLGIWLMVAGLARILATFFSHRSTGHQVLSAIIGVLFLIGGVACLRDLAKGALVLAFIVALTWMMTGLAEFVLALATSGGPRAWLIVLALVSIVIGFVFMLWPAVSLATLVVLLGVSCLVIGTGEVIIAFQLRRAWPATS